MASQPFGTIYGVAVRDAKGLGLVARIARRSSGIYYLIPRANADFGFDADANWDPHASYHADGWHHVKSFNQVTGPRTKRQPLLGFTGAEPLFDQSFQPGDLTGLALSSPVIESARLFEIPAALIQGGAHYALSVSLLSPGATAPQGPWLRRVIARTFEDTPPWVHVALWQGLAGVGDG